MQYNIEKISRLSKIFTVLVIVYPFTAIYATPIKSVSFGDVLILSAIVPMTFDVIVNKKKHKLIPFWGYLGYALFISIVFSLVFMVLSYSYSVSHVLNRVVRDSYYLLTIVVFGQLYFKYSYARKVIKYFTIVLGVFIIIQSLFYMMAGVYIPGIIPQLKTTISGGITGAEYNDIFQYKAEVYGYVRSSGFLSEPAVVGQVVSVALLLELFNDDRNPNMVLCVFYSMIMVLSFSTNSYVALIACWGLWVLFSNRNKRTHTVRMVVFIIILLATLVFLLSNDKTASVFMRFFELRDRISGSSVIRVLRGMAFFLNMPLLFQIFGSGFGNFFSIKEIYGITTIYEQSDEYMNTNAYILVSVGIIGFLLFIITILRSIRENKIVSKMVFGILLIFGLSSSIYSTPQFMVMMMFILYGPKESVLDEDSHYYASQYL